MTDLTNPRTYILDWLRLNSVSINERGECISPSRKDNTLTFTTLYLDYQQQVKAHNVGEKQKLPRFRNTIVADTDKTLKRALDEIIGEKKIEVRLTLLNSFKCTQENLDQLKAFTKAVIGSDSLTEVNVLAHWLWQVKKKINHQDPSYHIMPIFFGKQEGGKTQALNHLIKPLNAFRLNIDLNQMTDDRYFRAMSENYVIVFDEMAGAQRTDMNALKKQITTDYNDYRPMGTNDVFKVRQSCSFIAATNQPVAELLVDTTGMRRFFQINCSDKLDWEAINSIDYDKLWQGIDENKHNGYLQESMNEIRQEQQELVAKDAISLFLEDYGIIVGKTPTKAALVSTLYLTYSNWCLTNGFKPDNASWFSRKVIGKGFTKGSKTDPITQKTVRFINIPVEVILVAEVTTGWR